MHYPDAGAHEGAAEKQTRHGDRRPRDDVEGDGAREDCRDRRNGRYQRVIRNGDGKAVGEHTHEVHRPHAEPHGERAAGQPNKTRRGIDELGDTRSEAEEGVTGER